MEHLNEEQLIEQWLEAQPLSADARAHLAACEQCQALHDAVGLLRDELLVARASSLRPDMEAKLLAIFDEATRDTLAENPLRRMADQIGTWVQALPRWDSRHQAGALTVRNANRTSYRLLYSVQATEVELMVEAHQGALRVIGEVIVGDPAAQSGLALIELITHVDAKSAIEAESDTEGHFALDHVPPGNYIMTITPRYGDIVVIKPLELT